MTLKQLLDIISRAYPDGFLANYYDDVGRPKPLLRQTPGVAALRRPARPRPRISPRCTMIPMATIRIDLTDQQLTKLQEVAEALEISVEDLARLGIQQTILTEDQAFLQAANRVISKNQELYRRLA